MFVPGSNDPVVLDRAMRGALADSLAYIAEAAGGTLDLPAAALGGALAAIGSHRVAPGVFGRYYKTVVAVQSGRLDEARAWFLQLIAVADTEPAFSVRLYTEGSLGSEKRLYGDLIDLDTGGVPWLCPPGDMDESFGRRVAEALGMIATADRALADEIRGLVVQVVGAAPSHGAGARPFGSVSSFMLWGLMVVNVERYRTAADLIQGLVHEAAHLLLFSHSIAEPLVTNPIEERYTSPLRSDPRPMDGVFHATFVAARMHYVNRRLREAASDMFAPVPLPELDERLSTLRHLYIGGLETVRAHARLTATGRMILEESMDYMQAA